MKTITLKGKAGKTFQAKVYATFTHTIDGHDHKFMLTRVSTGVNPELKEISITEQTGVSVAKFTLCPPSKYSQFTYLCCEFELYVGTLSDTRGMIAFAEALLDEVIHKHGAVNLNKKLQALRS